ncbi:glycosyltransferase family 2 protein [Sphingobium rhizovicinum]|uniref:Glycosyltransferase family 2 protein n=1 Tax=Sphingobium rhizovicinum TaxID=432308 RepID=A0ABV7NCI5_9SPHN
MVGFLNLKKQGGAQGVPEEGRDSLLAGAEPIKVEAGGVMASGISLDTIVLLNRGLTLKGWLVGSDRIEVLRDGSPVRARVSRLSRPDVQAAHPHVVEENPGFDILVQDARAGQYHLRCHNFGGTGLVRDFLLAVEFGTSDSTPTLASLPKYFEDSHSLVGAIDKAFPMGEGGLIIFGWMVDLHASLKSVSFHTEKRSPIDVTDKFFRLARMDVAANLKGRFPQVTEMAGFVLRVDGDVSPNDVHALCFDCGDRGKAWLLVDVDAEAATPLQVVKDVLTFVPAPDRIRHSLFDLFDKVLGEPISTISPEISRHRPKPQVKQFGTLPPSTDVSIIVPLYGRYDFLKYQMARFKDDADFDRVDLIYVVDDPDILSPTLDMAAAMYDLYRLPFRVVWYNRNMGFAGANNMGAGFAVAPRLLLLNSDVIPQKPGWLGDMIQSLDEPGVGAVGPLLQFFDGSVQHAGMRPKEDPYYPGFVLNVHPGKGAPWWGADDSYDVPLLTAACLMLRADMYRELGGLDEGYIIGDFEDSDLCLKLRKRKLKLVLNAKPRLWHLERQSQNLQSITSYRHLLTLYNGWRYKKKIESAELADPWEN